MDDVVSECGLDDYDAWDLQIVNNNQEDNPVEIVLKFIQHSICN